MVEVLPWHHAADPQALVRTIALALAHGKLVGFPTETAYQLAASVLVPEAVERLAEGSTRLTLALRHAAEVADWVPELSTVGWRFSRRCWPGPVTLIFGTGTANGLVERLPEPVRARLCPNGELAIRVSGHPALAEVLRLLQAPLVLAPASRNGEPDATEPGLVRERLGDLGDRIDLLLDDGPSRLGQPDTELRVIQDRWEVVRAGVIPAETLEELASCFILFVCTGNTCRSPLAEGLCRKLLADRLGCGVEELARRGFVVRSAGISAMMGYEATPEAVATAASRGVDLSAHASRPLTAAMLAQADHVFAMTRSHLWAVADRYPSAGPRLRLLAPDGRDIPDPIGGEQEVYDRCAEQLVEALRAQIPQLWPDSPEFGRP